MSVMVLLEFRSKPDCLERLKEKLAEWLPDTRSYEGCSGTGAYSLTDDPHLLVMVERWESREHYERYRNWRADTGVRAQLVAMLEGPPIVRYFEQLDA